MTSSETGMMRHICLTGLASALSAMCALAQDQGGGSSTAQSRPAETRAHPSWAIRHEQDAVSRAREIVGLPEESPPPMSAQLVTLAVDNTPFLHDRIEGRPIWDVVIADWRLKLESAPTNSRDQYSRVFDIFIDPTDGKLLKAVSRWPEGVPAVAPEPSAQSAEEQMPRSGREKYLGFPDGQARVTLLRALDIVMAEGDNPLIAKQILAHYVMQTRMRGKPRPVWAITLRGIPPIKSPPPGVSVDALNHIRVIIDAETGKWLGAGTCPQPETGAPPAETKDAEEK
jgi:hypothetical protein